MIKTLRLMFVLLLLGVVGTIVLVTAKPQKPEKRNALDLYAMQATVVNPANGAFIYTSDLAIANEKDLKSGAANYSAGGSAILIGTGSTNTTEPITDIQIVGIGGVAYGNITECPPPEE